MVRSSTIASGKNSIAWRRASVSNLRRQFLAPAASGVAFGLLLLALGMRNGYALVSYTLAGFVTTTIAPRPRRRPMM